MTLWNGFFLSGDLLLKKLSWVSVLFSVKIWHLSYCFLSFYCYKLSGWSAQIASNYVRTVFWSEFASLSSYSQLSEAELAKSSLWLFLWTVTGSTLLRLSLGLRFGFWKLFFLSLLLVDADVRSETKGQRRTKVSKLSSNLERFTYKEKVLSKEVELRLETRAP